MSTTNICQPPPGEKTVPPEFPFELDLSRKRLLKEGFEVIDKINKPIQAEVRRCLKNMTAEGLAVFDFYSG